MKDYLKQVDKDILEYFEDVRSTRRDLHKIPELGFKEYKTQEYIQNFLRNLGYDPESIVGTGTILFIKGDVEGKTVALRSDIDALPIEEPNNKDFVSLHKGQMHACGHDGHMSMLLFLAKYLKEHPEVSHRNLLLIFQPAEESPGGALPILETGIFDKYDIGEIYGFHLIPFIEEGVISSKEGPMFAMTSEFYPVIHGKAAHAGEPENGIDAIVAASQFVLAVQSIISRNKKPTETGLINIGTLNAGDVMNVVPEVAKLSGTLRTYDQKTHNMFKNRLKDILEGIDKANGTKSELNFIDMYKPLINDKVLFEKVWSVATEPKELFEEVMLAEDFSMYLDKVPGVFIGLGTKNDECNSGLHTPEFNFSEEVLLRGIDLYLNIIKNV